MTAQSVFVVLLLVAPAAAVIAFTVGGVQRVRRRSRLARAAHEAGLLFSADDPFDLPRRYADFALIGAGHGGRATHVTYGRMGGLPVRAFDFRYEIGHGARRLSRHYAVVVVEGDGPLVPFLLWNHQHADLAPLAARQVEDHLAGWACRGAGAARAVANLSPDLSRAAAGIEAARSVLLVCAPVRHGGLYVGRLEDIVALASALAGGGTDSADRPESDV